MSTKFVTSRLPGPFGLSVSGISLPDLDDHALKTLLHTLYANRFLVIRTGGLSESEYVRFARRVGQPISFNSGAPFPEIIPITNVGVDTLSDRLGAAHWHTDQSFTRELSSVTMLYSVAAPAIGGETRFCDMVAAYEALPATKRQAIDSLVVEHRHGTSVAAQPGDHTPIPPKNWDQGQAVWHPLVRHHPITGCRTLYAVTGTSQGIAGMAHESAVALLRELTQHVFQPRFVTEHRHQVNDLVMWDNPTTMHSATPIGAATGPSDTRLINRISLRGRPSVFEDE